MVAVVALQHGGEPLLVHANVTQLLVHDGVDVGSGGNLPLEQGWSQLGLELDLLRESPQS